jgi:triacylglycerol lipase
MNGPQPPVYSQPRSSLSTKLDSRVTDSPRLTDLQGVHNSMPPPGLHITRASLPRLQFTSHSSMPSEDSTAPIVRWLSSWSSTPNKSPTHARSRSESPTSYSEPRSPPSPCLSSLNEALSSQLPNLPAKPPSAYFYGSRNLSRQPPFLDNLTRSTLPTASLSRAMPLSPLIPFKETNTQVPDTHPVIITHSPPTRSSIDTLRNVWDRGIHTSAPAPTTATSRLSWWWSQGENKENVDTLLHEDDRADTAQEERDQIRRKCAFALRTILIFAKTYK